MELHYYRDKSGNFGDDLNAVMWHALLPPWVFDVPATVLLGIGSILSATHTPGPLTVGKRVFVIGSGAGYGALPQGWPSWNILAVRGPLTAQLIDRPECAATDAAVLLATLNLTPEFTTPDRTLFIPHHQSMPGCRWQMVASRAGITFVDPRWPVSHILKHFSSAKLVIAEAMHGAVLADTFRIPWIPVIMSPDILPFKWRDWTLSLDLPYQPHRLAPSSAWEALRHRVLQRRSQRAGLPAPGRLSSFNDPAHLLADYRARYASPPGVSSPAARKDPDETKLRRVAMAASKHFDDFWLDRATRQLIEIARAQSFLSSDQVLHRGVDRLQQAVASLVRSLA